jgi:CubicO group peptidase (beta-lactamase class C family)
MKTVKIFTILFLVSINNSISYAQKEYQTSTLYTKIDKYLEAGSKNGFAGAIAVIKNGEIVINEGYGFANKKTKLLNNPKTIFDIGSNTKQFTATAIMKLFEMGKLQLTDPLKLYFKNLPNDKKHITIHQLLTHTSGLEDAIGRDFDKISQDEFFKKVFSSKLLTKPGNQYSYSNIGYSVLGRIIELVSQEEYEVFLNKHFFTPAGMKQTGYLLPKWDSTQISRSYNRGILEGESPTIKYQKNKNIGWHLKANGGINSTQNDMILWYKALKSYKIISKNSFKKMSTAYAEYPNSKLSYGYGWTVKTLEGNNKRIAHNGSNGAYSHSIIWYPEKDIYIVYVTNANSEKVEFVAYVIAKMIMNETYAPKPIENNVYAFAFNYMKNNSSNKPKKLVTLLKEMYADNFTSSRLLNSIGNILLMMNQHKDWAVALFKMNVELYPDDGNLWDSLGDGYKANNQKEEAKKSYKKAVELGYKGSQKKLTKLSKN